MSKRNFVAGILAGFAGGITIIVTFLVFQFLFVLSMVLGLACYIGVYLILTSMKPKVELDLSYEGVTPELLQSTLKDGNDKLALLRVYASQIKNPGVVGQLTHIIEIINRIFENFKKDPKDIKASKQFLTYYFDSTIKIVKMYVELSTQSARTPEIEKTLLRTEDMLNSIGVAFEKLLTKLLASDIMNLDVEIETLDKTFKAENLN
jgi:5-bromo-4-chloroindolyl phosphate hydrolysis protein